jgi:hypothetical protein
MRSGRGDFGCCDFCTQEDVYHYQLLGARRAVDRLSGDGRISALLGGRPSAGLRDHGQRQRLRDLRARRRDNADGEISRSLLGGLLLANDEDERRHSTSRSIGRFQVGNVWRRAYLPLNGLAFRDATCTSSRTMLSTHAPSVIGNQSRTARFIGNHSSGIVQPLIDRLRLKMFDQAHHERLPRMP